MTDHGPWAGVEEDIKIQRAIAKATGQPRVTAHQLERETFGEFGPPRPKNRIVVALDAAQGRFRSREILDELGDVASGRWLILPTSGRYVSERLQELRGRRLEPGDIIDFYGAWEDGGQAEHVLMDLRLAGWNGDRMSALLRQKRARDFELDRIEAVRIAREIHAPGTPNP